MLSLQILFSSAKGTEWQIVIEFTKLDREMEKAKAQAPFPLAFSSPQAQPSTHPVELLEKTVCRVIL